MKKLLIASAALALALPAGIALAKPAPKAAKPLPASYQAVYCYPTGSYWQSQFSNPNNLSYYAAHDAQFRALYGPGTIYCP